MPSIPITDRSTSPEARVAQAVDEFLARRAAGDNPSISDFVERYSDIAAVLPDVLGALDALAHIDLAQEDLPFPVVGDSPGREGGGESGNGEIAPRNNILGDYRIIRELGRGGMGIVYEAEQISLSRRVALKILPFAAVLDPRHLQRFKNEALAAAHLDHPNIVEVYGVGCERGVHFYAMRYVEGQTLAAVIEALKDEGAPRGRGSPRRDPESQQDSATFLECPGAPGSQLSISNGAHDTIESAPRDIQSGDPGAPGPHSKDTVAAALSTLRTTRPKDYFRRVADLGIQAAEALDHAHQMGIVHRDIKPSNLMLDERGKLWVTDFGLAHIESEASLTITGDLLGTLRYMSPEQALAKRVTVDHRTDIYSLGVTLYECLALRPAYSGEDREELLRQIAFQEPSPLRRVNPAIPVDLETIVHKAMAKNTDERFATAREFADDLRRLVDQQPIKARRASPIERGRRWVGRHATLVTAALAALLFIAASGIVATVLIARAYKSESDERTRAVHNWQRAEGNLEIAQANLQVASEAVDNMMAELVKGPMTAMTSFRAWMIIQRVKKLHEMLMEQSDDPKLRIYAATTHRRAAYLFHLIGMPDNSEGELRRASELVALALQSDPQSADFRYMLGDNELNLARFLWAIDDYAGAEEPLREALSIYERLTDEAPDVPLYQVRLGDTLNYLGQVHWLAGRSPEADKCFARATEMCRQLPTGHVAAGGYQPFEAARLHGALLNNLALVARRHKDFAAAIDLLDQAILVQERAQSQDPNDIWVKDYRYRHYRDRAETLHIAGRHEDAALAVEKLCELSTEQPQAFHEGADLLLRCAAQLGKLHDAVGSSAGATGSGSVEELTPDACRKRARELLAKAVTAPTRTTVTCDHLCWFLLTCPDESFRNPTQVLSLVDWIVKSAPKRLSAWRTLALAHYRLGSWQEARLALSRGLTASHATMSNRAFVAPKALEIALGDDPEQSSDATTLLLVAMIEWQQGNQAEARQMFKRATTLSAPDKKKIDPQFATLLDEAGLLLK